MGEDRSCDTPSALLDKAGLAQPPERPGVRAPLNENDFSVRGD